MAVQLARVSLWLATLAADRPLGFLDHRLRTGDSLLGAWLADLRRAPRSVRGGADRDLPLFAAEAPRDALREAVPMRFSLEAMPTETIEQVRAKERAHESAASVGALSAWRRIADVWCATWFARPADGMSAAAFGPLTDAILTGAGQLPKSAADRCLAASSRIADARRFFHWELEFPEVFFEASGSRSADAGFDAIVGNPPSDMIRADTGPSSSREDARQEASRLVRFTRDAGIYSAQSDGPANPYPLFLERSVELRRPDGR